jgi:sulfate adenylyltransferase
MKKQIAPHGGTLINRIAGEARAKQLNASAAGMKRIKLPPREQCDVEMIAIGAFSPLTGFHGQEDFNRVCDRMQLASGLAWPIPVTCSVDKAKADSIKIGETVLLTDGKDRPLAGLTVEEKYAHDKKKEASLVYRTDDTAHPGVAVVMSQGDVCLGGPIEVLKTTHEPEFPTYRLTPAQTRAAFAERAWKTVVAFQTRNPIHRAHEYLTKVALEMTDGLLIHPLVGETQAGDIPADTRMKCYEVLIDKYYNKERVMLTVMPAAMRYAGPREAILHAIVRKNYGCTHFIVGRDHAGVGNYYGTYDAQLIFDEFDPSDLEIVPLKFEHTMFCKACGGMVSGKTCPHGQEEKVFLSGTKVRDLLAKGERPPVEFTRAEVADLLIQSMR